MSSGMRNSSVATASEPAQIVRRAAMSLLARREHAFFELLQKLGRKYPEFDTEDVLLPALRRLQEDNLQSDARFAEAWVRYRSLRGFGPLKIASELQPRKLDRDLQKSALYESGPDWEQLCEEVLRRKFRIDANPSMADRLRWQRFLQQRGFEQEQIRAACKAVLVKSS